MNQVGIHFNHSKNAVETFKQWKMPVAVVLDHDADAWTKVKELSPDTILVGRVLPDEGQDWANANVGYEARQAFARIEPFVLRMEGIIDYWIPWNEPVVQSGRAMKNYSAATVRFLRHMNNINARCAIGGFARGNPPIGLWTFFHPAIRQALGVGGIFHVHEYGWPHMLTDVPWHALRITQLYEGNLGRDDVSEADKYPGLPRVFQELQVLITECGIDRGRGIRDGWRATDATEEEFIGQVMEYDILLRSILGERYLGCAVYCDCNGMWKSYKVPMPEMIAAFAEEEDTPMAEPLGIFPMQVGLHAPNAMFTDRFYEMLLDARIDAVKAMSYVNRADELFKTKLPTIVRLYDARIRSPDHGIGATAFVTGQAAFIRLCLERGITYFEVHNEPNHPAGIEGWGSSEDNARSFRDWFEPVIRTLKHMFPEAKFGFPGLATNHNDLYWIRWCRPVIRLCDWVGFHGYWQYDNYRSEQWGNRHIYYHKRLRGMDIHVTECGDSSTWDSHEVKAQRLAAYYDQLRRFPWIKSAHAFIASSPDLQWDKFAWMDQDGNYRPYVEAIRNLDMQAPMPFQSRLIQIGRFLRKNHSVAERYRDLDDIKGVCIHHAGVVTDPWAIAKYHTRQKPNNPDKEWRRAAYAFLIDGDTACYQMNPLNVITNHCAVRNPDLIGVVFNDSYPGEERPPVPMVQVYHELHSYLEAKLGRSLSIHGHKDLIKTRCPGDSWKGWKSVLTS